MPARGKPLLALALVAFCVAVLLLAASARPSHAPPPPPPCDLRVADALLRVEVLCEEPVVRLYEGFLLDAEIEELLSLYLPRLAPSTVMSPRGGTQVHPGRTSWTAFLPLGSGGDALERIERRAVTLSGRPRSHLENLQLVRYEPGQRYEPHFDYFTEDHDSQRTTSIFAYLNDADPGACTEFPELGLCVAPRKGRAVSWENCAAHGLGLRVEPKLKHGGRPPASGVKYGLNVWFRSAPQRGL